MAFDKGLTVTINDDLFSAAMLRGRLFACCDQVGVTVTTGGFVTNTKTVTLYNPLGSGVRGKLWYAGVTLTVAWPTAAAALHLCANTNPAAAATTGTAATAMRNLKLGGAAPQLKPLITSVTLPAAPIGLALMGAPASGALTVQPVMAPLGRWFNGAVSIEPGCTLSFEAETVGGTSGTFGEFIWEEEDI